jgi:rhodanese-related sulfurtransferase
MASATAAPEAKVIAPIAAMAHCIPRRLRELPKNREIVAYCRGPYCVFAYEAVALLRERGFSAIRLEEGFPEWRAAGLPVETIGVRQARESKQDQA